VSAGELTQMEGRNEVDLHGRAEVLEGLVLRRDRRAVTGVVDEHVDVSRDPGGALDETFTVRSEGQICGDGEDTFPQCIRESVESICSAGSDDDGGSRGVEHPGEAVTETRGGSGDDGDGAVESEEARDVHSRQ